MDVDDDVGTVVDDANEQQQPPTACSSSTHHKLPHWHRPQPPMNPPSNSFPITGLNMYNSLTRQKELFIPMHGTKQITWYMYVSLCVFANPLGGVIVCIILYTRTHSYNHFSFIHSFSLSLSHTRTHSYYQVRPHRLRSESYGSRPRLLVL